MSIDTVYILPCTTPAPLHSIARELGRAKVRFNGTAALITTFKRFDPEEPLWVKMHRRRADLLNERMAKAGQPLDARGLLCVSDLEVPPSRRYVDLAVSPEISPVWLPFSNPSNCRTFEPSNRSKEAREKDRKVDVVWVLVVSPKGAARSLRAWTLQEELIPLDDGGYLVLMDIPRRFSEVSEDVWSGKNAAKRYGEGEIPFAFPSEHLAMLQRTGANSVEAVLRILGPEARRVDVPIKSPPWKTISPRLDR